MWWATRRLLAGFACVIVLGGADWPPPTPVLDGSLRARLATESGAMEYWDVTVWLDSGERFFARFLVTNQGPGDRTAAAVGHLVLADGHTLPFRWGRRDGAWTLDTTGTRMKIGKAHLEIQDRAVVVVIDSKKHGIEAHFEIERRGDRTGSRYPDVDYEVEVAVPSAARGTITPGGATTPREVAGSGAVVHTSLLRNESDLIRRRDELLLRDGTVALYVGSVVRADGTRRTMIVPFPGLDVTDAATPTPSPPTVTLDESTSAWRGDIGYMSFDATIGRELLRMNPLEILPQPFRFLLSLGGEPQRVWADARATVKRLDRDAAVELRGIAVSTFAHSER